jgi:hypothetical protein
VVDAPAHAAEVVQARRLVEVGCEPDRRRRAQPEDERAADPGDGRIVERRGQRREPPGARHGVVVEERDQVATRRRQAGIPSVRCAEARLVERAQWRAFDALEVGEDGRCVVARRVVHHQELRAGMAAHLVECGAHARRQDPGAIVRRHHHADRARRHARSDARR